MRKLFAGIAAALLIGGCDAPPTTYPGPWQDDGPVFMEIAKAFAQKRLTGCGEFYYKLAGGSTDPGEALVYCTADGKTWKAYLVFYRTGKVMPTAVEDAPPY